MTEASTQLNSKDIAVIGAGKVGYGLAQALLRAEFKVTIGAGDPARTRNRLADLAEKQIPISITGQIQAVQTADIVLLTVPDDDLSDTCNSLARHFKAKSVVAHCSGYRDSSDLSSARQQGCSVCSLHPLNTFPSISAGIQLLNSDHRTYLYCEGDERALAETLPVFKRLGFQPITIQRAAKPLYHTACVFACNYLTTLMELSLITAESAKLDRQQFWQSLQPLIHATLENIGTKGTAQALSGPIARGDIDTVTAHLNHLSMLDKNLQSSYADLGRHTLALAETNAELQAKTIDKLGSILTREID